MISEICLDPSCSFLAVPLQSESLNIRLWGSPESARAAVLLVHGLGAHSAWFEAAARELVRQNFLVLAYDQIGFGSRRDSKLRSYRQWIDELTVISAYLKSLYRALPLYVLGNSMGGLVVTAAASLLDVNGFILSSPGFDGHPDAFSLSYKLKSLLSALIFPDRELTLPYGFEIVSRSAEVINWLHSDPLKRPALPGSMLMQLLFLSSSLLSGSQEFKAPLLMLTAGQERVVDNSASERVFARLRAPFKKHVCIKEAWHDLMFDPLVDEVADEIEIWLRALPGNSCPETAACAG